MRQLMETKVSNGHRFLPLETTAPSGFWGENRNVNDVHSISIHGEQKQSRVNACCIADGGRALYLSPP